MNKSESKYLNTARLMDEAFILLLDKKDYEFITVKEICEKAGVNRSTFYLHYETINDLLEESLEFLTREFIEKMSVVSGNVVETLKTRPLEELYFVTPEFLSPYLDFIKERRKLLSAVIRRKDLYRLDKTYDKLFGYVFNPILDRFSVPDDERPYMMAFYLNGLTAIITEWIKSDCEKPKEEIIALMQKCVVAFEPTKTQSTRA